MLTEIIIAAVLASLIFLGYHYRNQWLPLFKKTEIKPEESTSMPIDTQIPIVSLPKPTVVDSQKLRPQYQ
ncbi:MAG: hypothetical protein IPO94_06825 [Saprospiraceae bacterium]|nr:hypothetical protein [Saprospiraceae bacterium]